MNRLERKILGMLRRHRWMAFRWLSMSRLIRRSGGAFREVTIALINLEQSGYIRWPNKSSLKYIAILRRTRDAKVFLDRQKGAASEERVLRVKHRPNGPEQSSRRRRRAD